MTAPLGRRKLTPAQWLAIINRLDIPSSEGLLITGGEPFLYAGLVDIVEGLPGMKVRINTNMGPVTKEQIRRIAAWQSRVDGELMLYTAYHYGQPGVVEVGEFAEKFQLARELGLRIKASIVGQPGQNFVALKKRFQNSYKIKLDVKKETRARMHFTGVRETGPCDYVTCKTDALRLIGPDGFRYPCASAMVRGVMTMEDLLNQDPSPTPYVTDCIDYGLCLPCDHHGPREITLKERACGSYEAAV